MALPPHHEWHTDATHYMNDVAGPAKRLPPGQARMRETEVRAAVARSKAGKPTKYDIGLAKPY